MKSASCSAVMFSRSANSPGDPLSRENDQENALGRRSPALQSSPSPILFQFPSGRWHDAFESQLAGMFEHIRTVFMVQVLVKAEARRPLVPGCAPALPFGPQSGSPMFELIKSISATQPYVRFRQLRTCRYHQRHRRACQIRVTSSPGRSNTAKPAVSFRASWSEWLGVSRGADACDLERDGSRPQQPRHLNGRPFASARKIRAIIWHRRRGPPAVPD
jgi:hypothetical protein